MTSILNTDNWIDSLPAAVRDAILERIRPIELAAGRALYEAGDAAAGVFHVAGGHLRLTGLQQDGRQVLITLYAPGACFAETAVVARRRLNHSVVAMTPSTVGLLPAADFWDLYDRWPAIADALCRKFAETIGRQLAAREARAAQRLGQRIAALFVDLADRCGVPTGDGVVVVDLPLTHTDLAEFFDVTRQSVQREMTLLKRMTGLSKVGGRWEITVMKALRSC